MDCRSRRRRVAASIVALLVSATGVLAQIRLPEGTSAAILDRLEGTDALTAFAISADGETAALASAVPGKNEQSDLRLFSTRFSEQRAARVDGRFRDLLFSTDGRVLYGILHRAAKRGGDTHLVLIDPAKMKVKRANRLPVGAADLDHWITARALLIAAPAEIRTLLLPELRSGPLFAVDATARAVVSLGGSSQVLVGHDRGVDLLDLEDRPGIETMPVREHVDTAAPVQGLAAAADGASALARLADGSLFTVTVSPLRLSAAGSGTVVAAPPVVAALADSVARSEPPPRSPPRAQRVPPPRPADAEEEQAPARAEPEPAKVAPPPSAPEAPATPTTPPPRDDVPRTPPRPVPDKQATPPPPSAAPDRPPPKIEPEVEPATAGAPQIRGRLTGAAASQARFVVLRGPDNLLLEAKRVRPAADGTWSVDGLRPGRYRVQADPGDGGVLVTRPPFLVLDVKEQQVLTAPDLEVVRGL